MCSSISCRLTDRFAPDRSFTVAQETDPCKLEAVPASSGPHCRGIQQRDPATALSAETSPSVRSGEPRPFPLHCRVCHGHAPGNAFSSVSLFKTVVVFSVGFSVVLVKASCLTLAPLHGLLLNVPLRTRLCFLRFLLEMPSLPLLQMVNIQ